MLYQLLTGDRPFEGSMTAIMHKVMTTTPPRPSELAVTVPASFDSVVAMAMARRPEHRFDTAAAFAQALRTALATPPETRFESDATIIAPPASTASAPTAVARSQAAYPEAAPGKRRSRLPPYVAGGVALTAMAGVVAWLLVSGGSHPAPVRQATLAPQIPPAPPQAPPEAVRPAVPPAHPAPTLQPQPVPAPVAVEPPAPPPQPAKPPAPPAPVTANQRPAQPPPPQPVKPTVQAAPEQSTAIEPPHVAPVPAASAAAVEAALAAALPLVQCSLVQGSVADDRSVTVTGLAGAGQPDESLRRAVDAAGAKFIDWRVTNFDGPYCAVLDALRSMIGPRAQARSLQLAQAAPGSLHDNAVIALRATMPAFGGYLQVAYLQHDSTVAPLVPGPGYPAQTYEAGATIDLGAPRANFEGWHVGPPFGTDMILSIASTAPLFAAALPDTQPQGAYLANLRAAVDDLRQHGGTVSAAVVLLDTRP